MSDPSPAKDLDLSGSWRARCADDELRRRWYTDGFDDSDFAATEVPGHWRNDPNFAANDDPVLYRRQFTTTRPDTSTRSWLELDGVCSQGDIWLDETYLGNTDGAWVPHRFDVTEAIAARTDHVLAVEVTSPPLGDPSAKKGLLGTWQDGPYVEPGWNPGGIWRPARIRRTGPVAITTHRVLCTAATTERATVTISCVFDSDAPLDATLRTTIAGIDDERTRRLAVGPNAITWAIDIPDPPLWWPRELGDQPLVDVTVTVSTVDATDTDATPSDSFTRRCGLRSVEVCDWILRVNGERLFAKGVLVGPAAHDLGTAPPESFTRQIARAHDAGCNLVRVHSHISRDELYDAADEHGMLLWQDLPLYRGQHRSVRSTAIRTARAAVDRLGAHPSIILWCGHDEPDHPGTTAPARRFTRRLAAHELPNWNRSVLDPSVKRALSTADPSRPTIASSGTWPRPPKLAGSDTHLGFGWSTGTVDDLERLARAMPRSVRFVQITPNPTMLRAPELQPPSRWPPTDPTDLVEGDTGTTDIGLLAARVPPDAFLSAEQWHRATLNHQAMLIRTQIEVLRRLKYRPTGGFVIAHLDDIRPAVSTSLIAYDGAPKPAFDALQLACTPILVTLDRWPECAHPGDELDCDVHIVNDTRAPLTAARIDVRLRWTDGDRVHGGATWAFEGDTAADSVELVGRIRAEIPAGVDRVTAELRLSTSTGEHQFHYGAPVHTDHDHD